MEIAVCDDDSATACRIKIILEKHWNMLYKRNLHIAVFENAGCFLKEQRRKRFHLVFLDIEMPKKDGFEIAGQLRREFPETELIFISDYDDLVYQSFNFRPFRFIRKSRMQEELGPALEDFLKEKGLLIPPEEYFEFGAIRRKFLYADIQFIEVYNHELILHFVGGINKQRGSLVQYEKDLLQRGFIKPNRSYLVNMDHIRGFGQSEITMDDEWNSRIEISQRRQSEITEVLNLYKKQRKKNEDRKNINQ